MELKKVWMSPDTKKKSKYGYRAVGGILGIVLLMVLLLCGGTLLSLSLGINKKAFSIYYLHIVSFFLFLLDSNNHSFSQFYV